MKPQRGHAMLELALSAGVMLSFLAGTFQFGYTFYVYDQLVTAVGNGGRYAAMRTYRAATPADIEKCKTAIRNMVVYGDARPALDAAPVVPHLAANQVKVAYLSGENGAGENGAPSAVNVSIDKYQVNAVFHSFDFTGRPTAQFPFIGRFAPSESEP